MTTCDHIRELLPWWLNGTLDAEESAEVEDSLRNCAECRRALRETEAVFEAVESQQRPSSESLTAFAWGETASREVADHLETSPIDREAVSLARASRALMDPLSVEASMPQPPFTQRAAGWLSAAAAVVLLAIAAQLVSLRQELARQARPSVDGIVVDVFSDRRIERSSSSSWEGAPVLDPERPLTLLLHPESDRGTFAVRLIEERGDVKVSLDDVPLSEAGDIVLGLPAGTLVAGRYRAEVEAEGSAAESFFFVLASPTSTNDAQ